MNNLLDFHHQYLEKNEETYFKMKIIEIDITATIFTKHIISDPSIKNILEKDVFKICEDWHENNRMDFSVLLADRPMEMVL